MEFDFYYSQNENKKSRREIKIGLGEHRGIILEAWQDYRRWFAGGISEHSDSFGRSDGERIDQIENAIEPQWRAHSPLRLDLSRSALSDST